MSDAITRLQDDVFAMLDTFSALTTVTIQQEDKGTILEKVQAPLRGIAKGSGKLPGLAILVTMPTFELDSPGGYQLEFALDLSVTVFEFPPLNRTAAGTQITSPLAVEYIFQRLHHRATGVGQLVGVAAEPINDGQSVIGYDCRFKVLRGIDTETRAATPRIDLVAGTCTITGAGHAGEAIYYTTDGSAPVPGGATVTTYSAPFAVSSGTLVRAATTATGYTLGDFAEVEA